MVDQDPARQPAAPHQPAAPQQRARRRRPVLLVLLIVMATLVVVGGVGAVVVYDRTTAIDRSTPAAVADQLLQAALVEKDPQRAGLFLCDGWSTDDAMRELEPRVGFDVRVSWAPVKTEFASDTSATVIVRMRFAAVAAGTTVEQAADWRIGTVLDDGWRVCELEVGPASQQ